jgi:SnoaL-like domain
MRYELDSGELAAVDTETTRSTETTSSTARRLVEAIARRDWDALGRCLASDVWMRALLPRETVECHTAASAVAVIAGWFGDAYEFELDRLEPDTSTGARVRVGWHARLRPDWEPDRWHVVEQVGFCKIVDGRVTRLDLVCTGFVRQ